jgi:hypothetical protein
MRYTLAGVHHLKIDWEHFIHHDIDLKKNKNIKRKTVCNIKILGTDDVVVFGEYVFDASERYVKDHGRRRSLALACVKLYKEFQHLFGKEFSGSRDFTKHMFDWYEYR